MKNKFKGLSLATYGIVLICFLLPFVNVTCDNEQVGNFSGIKLLTGVTIDRSDSDLFGGSGKQKAEPELLAIVAFCCGVVGLAFSFKDNKINFIIRILVGGFGTAMLALLTSRIKEGVLKESGGLLQVNFGIGYYLCLIFFLAAIGINIYIFSQSGNSLPVRDNIANDRKFCPKCGAKNRNDNEFCTGCGNRFG